MITIRNLIDAYSGEDGPQSGWNAVSKLIEAEREQYAELVEAMKRLASVEAFSQSMVIKSPSDDELINRIKYAKAAVEPFLPPPKLSELLDLLASRPSRILGPVELKTFADKARELEK
jgi:hypothetical protein